MKIKNMFFCFKGRIGRKQYWLNLLLLMVPIIAAAFIEAAIGLASEIFTRLIALFMIYPYLAIQAKRWHDRNKSAWWLLIQLVPILGPIWTLVELGFLKGAAEENRFGPDPLQCGSDACCEPGSDAPSN